MIKREFGKKLLALTTSMLVGGALCTTTLANAQDSSAVVIGKNNDWLFVNYDFIATADAPDIQSTIDILQRVNKAFEAKGITLALSITPAKIRVHQDQLPISRQLDTLSAENYDKIVRELAAGGMNVIDVNKAFMNSKHRSSDTPLFLRLDSHWSQVGAFTAAEAIKEAINSNPKLKAAWSATPEVKFSLSWAERKTNQRARDLVRMLPADKQSYPAEQSVNFKVNREVAASASLTGSGENVGILVIGSSFVNKGTGFPDAIRYQLQRELLDISIPVDQGPWVGMDAYLKDEAFKTNKPKLIIWEIPEREFRAPPSYKHRDPRYHFNNTAWLEKVTAALK